MRKSHLLVLAVLVFVMSQSASAQAPFERDYKPGDLIPMKVVFDKPLKAGSSVWVRYSLQGGKPTDETLHNSVQVKFQAPEDSNGPTDNKIFSLSATISGDNPSGIYGFSGLNVNSPGLSGNSSSDTKDAPTFRIKNSPAIPPPPVEIPRFSITIEPK
jgi:hypothetical protein